MKKENIIKIGKNLKQIRKSNGYTQERLAEVIECSPRYISDIEQDRSKPSYELLIKICNIFNISLDDLFAKYLDGRKSEIDFSFIGFDKLNNNDKMTIAYLIEYFNRENLA